MLLVLTLLLQTTASDRVQFLGVLRLIQLCPTAEPS